MLEQSDEWIWSPSTYNFDNSLDSNLENFGFIKNLKLEYNTESFLENYEISMSKKLLFNEENGWNWHKNWNVPSIYIKIQKTQNSPKSNNTFVGLFMVKKTQGNLKLLDLGLKGINIQKLNENIQQEVYFISLQIKTTSFYHNGEKFHFLLSFFTENDNMKNSFLSLISPPFRVDSREPARNSSAIFSFSTQISPFLQPFLPNHLSKTLIKRRKKEDYHLIENSVDGLFHFLSAPNLKFKVKHPLFMVIKFSNVFALYGKNSIIENKENMIQKLQEFLALKYSNSIIPKTNSKLAFQKHKEDFFILLKTDIITYGSKYEIVNNLIRIYNNYLINVITIGNDIPQEYMEYKNLKQLKKLYKLTYPCMISEKKRIFSLIQKPEKSRKDEKIHRKKYNKKNYLSESINKTKFYAKKYSKFKEINPNNDEENKIEVITSINSYTVNKTSLMKSQCTKQCKIEKIDEEVKSEKKFDNTTIELSCMRHLNTNLFEVVGMFEYYLSFLKNT